MRIGTREVGPGHPVWIVAESGLNHGGDPELAVRMVYAAKDAGADAFKVQVFDEEEFATPWAEYEGHNQRELFARYRLSFDALRSIRDACDSCGLTFFGTPTDIRCAAVLDALGAPCYKVGSDDIVHIPFLRELGRRGKSIILSSGMATPEEITCAVDTLEDRVILPELDVALLHCVSLYPCPANRAQIGRMDGLRNAVTVVGISDHTDGYDIAPLAVAAGATIIEKHFTIDRGLPGPDNAFSADPAIFRAMVDGIRRAEAALAVSEQRPDSGMRILARRSTVAGRDYQAGETVDSLAYMRTGIPGGVSPWDGERMIGKRLKHAKGACEMMEWDDLLDWTESDRYGA